jgi:hypothetical protein
MATGGGQSPLTDEQRQELRDVQRQMKDTSAFLNELLRGWNHAGDPEYESLQEMAKAAETAHEAGRRMP